MIVHMGSDNSRRIHGTNIIRQMDNETCYVHNSDLVLVQRHLVFLIRFAEVTPPIVKQHVSLA